HQYLPLLVIASPRVRALRGPRTGSAKQSRARSCAIDRDCFVAALLAMTASSRKLVLHQCAGGRAVFQAVAAAGAFQLLHLVQMARFQQGRPDRRFWAHLAAETAGIADRVIDPHPHLMPPTWCSR